MSYTSLITSKTEEHYVNSLSDLCMIPTLLCHLNTCKECFHRRANIHHLQCAHCSHWEKL